MKNIRQYFLKLKMTSSDVLFCPQPRDTAVKKPDNIHIKEAVIGQCCSLT